MENGSGSRELSGRLVEIPAIRGIQQKREFYSVMLPLRSAGRVCWSKDDLDESGQLLDRRGSAEVVELRRRRQRRVSDLRRSRLFQYLFAAAVCRSDYVLPAITCTIDDVEFVSIDGRLGKLRIRDDARWFLTDGQHRVAAIRRLMALYDQGRSGRSQLAAEELRRVDDLLAETLPVTVFVEVGDRNAQQMFADINRHCCKPPRELLDAFDWRRREGGEA